MAEDNAVEIQARAMGWRPEEEFRGDPGKWKDAETFVNDGYQILPILRERTKTMASKMDVTNQELAKTQSLLKTLTDHHKKTDERAYERAMKDIKADQRKAVENRDIETYDELDKALNDLEKPVESKADPNVDPGFIAWKDENPWYNEKANMAMYADSVAAFVEQQNPNLKGKPFFDKVTEEVKARYPEEFKNPNADKTDFVEGVPGDNDTGGKKSKKKTYSEMDDQAQKACDELVRGNIMTKEQYVKEYWGLPQD